MPSKLVSFINVLRSHDVRISPAETLDADEVVSLLGYRDRKLLRTGLSQTLAKTAQEKATFLQCFDRFFTYNMPAEATNDGTEDPSGLDPEQLAEADEALSQLQSDSDSDAEPRSLDLEGEMAADPGLAAQLDTPLMAIEPLGTTSAAAPSARE